MKDIGEIFKKLDSVTYNHSIRVMCIAKEIEEFYHYDNCILGNAALVHDIGKIFVSSKILDKVEKLDSIERKLINLHPYIGYAILKNAGVNEDVCRIVLYHHGANPIVLEPIEPINEVEIYNVALMLHSIDCFEALTSDRPYHRGFLAEDALKILFREKNHHPDVLNYVIDVLRNEDKYMGSAVLRGENCNNYDISTIFTEIQKINKEVFL